MNHGGNRQLDGSLSLSSSYSISTTKEELDATMARSILQLTMAQREAELEDLHKETSEDPSSVRLWLQNLDRRLNA
jgi:hypothetical protein